MQFCHREWNLTSVKSIYTIHTYLNSNLLNRGTVPLYKDFNTFRTLLYLF